MKYVREIKGQKLPVTTKMIHRNQIYIMGNIVNNIVKYKNGCEKIQNKV